jgi:DNA processing protein
MTESEAYVAFNLADNVGSVKVGAMLESFPTLAEAWERYPRKVSRNGCEVDWEGEFRKARAFGVEILTPADEAYPRQLKAERGHPLALYVKGDVGALSRPSIAMVGTRRATAYGLSVAERMSADLARNGWSIVSGLALGIDAASHRGALDARGATVGVLGSALDEFYPEENRDLARRIVAEGGAVVSQFPFGRRADKTAFPIRNHTVAALSHGLIAVEAPHKSGTLITASMAAEMGRTVMAVPARVDNRMSAGCLALIRSGARLVRNAADVAEEMKEFAAQLVPAAAPAADDGSVSDAAVRYGPEEALVMLHVGEDGISVDELVRKTGLSVSKVNSTAVMLRMKGFVRMLPGNRIALS